MAVVAYVQYRTTDGKSFADRDEAEKHESFLTWWEEEKDRPFLSISVSANYSTLARSAWERAWVEGRKFGRGEFPSWN